MRSIESDPDLQKAHALFPWIVTWDDHEVDNNYANDKSEDGAPRDRVPGAARQCLSGLLRAHAVAPILAAPWIFAALVPAT